MRVASDKTIQLLVGHSCHPACHHLYVYDKQAAHWCDDSGKRQGQEGQEGKGERHVSGTRHENKSVLVGWGMGTRMRQEMAMKEMKTATSLTRMRTCMSK